MPATKRLLPTLALFFLSPAIAELLSGSSSPAELFAFPGFLIIACLYGSGALLVRELTVRWHNAWPTVLLLGAANGIVSRREAALTAPRT